MKIRFIYQGDDYYQAREIIITKLCESVATIIDLPEEIEIKIAYLGESVYGNTNVGHRFKNRININSKLTVKEIPEIIIHELIHLNQIHTGLLRVSRIGQYYWNNKQYNISDLNKMEYSQYQQLPWEQDVANKQHNLLQKALVYAIKKG